MSENNSSTAPIEMQLSAILKVQSSPWTRAIHRPGNEDAEQCEQRRLGPPLGGTIGSESDDQQWPEHPRLGCRGLPGRQADSGAEEAPIRPFSSEDVANPPDSENSGPGEDSCRVRRSQRCIEIGARKRQGGSRESDGAEEESDAADPAPETIRIAQMPAVESADQMPFPAIPNAVTQRRQNRSASDQ